MTSYDANPPIVIDGVENFRSTGGYRTGHGVVRAGRLFRSGSLQAISAAGQRDVTDLGIGTVIDLRTDAERTGWPDLEWPDVRIVACPILDDSDDAEDDDPTMLDIYTGIIRDRSPQIAAVVRQVMAAGSGVIVHCYAGQDRTGIVVATILLAVGVHPDAVIADYVASSRDDAARELITATLDVLDRLYGGAEGLLRAGGFTDAELKQLCRALVE